MSRAYCQGGGGAAPGLASKRDRADALKLEGGFFFRHTALDGLLVLLSVANIAVIVATAVFFSDLGAAALGGLAVFSCFMICTNYQCIAHNFIHNRFFRAEPLNHLFSVVNSVSLGFSQTLYRMHHLNHHKYNNDRLDPVTGETGDFSSIYRFSKRGDAAESLWTHTVFGPLRTDVGTLYALAKKRNLAWLVWPEAAAMLVFYAGLAYVNWRFALFCLAPILYVGQALAIAENYLEHYGADPRNRTTNSVSCYGRFYNFIWFNNGYHQEHHYHPYVHWCLIPRVKREMLPESERRVVVGSHLMNLFYRDSA